MAATTRIMSYAKGLVEEGEKVEVWSCIPTGDFGGCNESEGYRDGIRFLYTYKRKRSSLKIKRVFDHFIAFFLLPFRFLSEYKKEKIDVVILSSDSIFLQLLITVLCRTKKVKTIFIFDEFPYPIRGKLRTHLPYFKKKAYSVSLKLFDGYISMTNNLLDFYQGICNHPGIVVSTITDLTRFTKTNEKTPVLKDSLSLVYMGNMELSKDNVDNIIRSFPEVLKNFNAHLYLYGRPSRSDKKILNDLIEELDLSKSVTFNYAHPDDVSKILVSADILLSSQPDTKRAMGGFPTKLGEYLMSGTPVLLTDVGETSKYFIDGKDMFFARPNSPSDYAEKIIYIKNNYEYALEVANNGRNKIITMYSHTKAGIDIKKFINNL